VSVQERIALYLLAFEFSDPCIASGQMIHGNYDMAYRDFDQWHLAS
jgi:hypothetical protein